MPAVIIGVDGGKLKNDPHPADQEVPPDTWPPQPLAQEPLIPQQGISLQGLGIGLIGNVLALIGDIPYYDWHIHGRYTLVTPTTAFSVILTGTLLLIGTYGL